MKILKDTSELYQNIIKAEDYLNELGIKIEFDGNKGVIIENTKTGSRYRTLQEMNDSFPRFLDCLFVLIED